MLTRVTSLGADHRFALSPFSFLLYVICFNGRQRLGHHPFARAGPMVGCQCVASDFNTPNDQCSTSILVTLSLLFLSHEHHSYFSDVLWASRSLSWLPEIIRAERCLVHKLIKLKLLRRIYTYKKALPDILFRISKMKHMLEASFFICTLISSCIPKVYPENSSFICKWRLFSLSED